MWNARSHGVRYRRKFPLVLAEYSTTILHHQGRRFTTKNQQHLGDLSGYNLRCSIMMCNNPSFLFAELDEVHDMNQEI
jgi:hypothetical protein